MKPGPIDLPAPLRCGKPIQPLPRLTACRWQTLQCLSGSSARSPPGCRHRAGGMPPAPDPPNAVRLRGCSRGWSPPPGSGPMRRRHCPTGQPPGWLRPVRPRWPACRHDLSGMRRIHFPWLARPESHAAAPPPQGFLGTGSPLPLRDAPDTRSEQRCLFPQPEPFPGTAEAGSSSAHSHPVPAGRS
ncbi:hypothetical protein D3C76_1015300 [compost metagenome]